MVKTTYPIAQVHADEKDKGKENYFGFVQDKTRDKKSNKTDVDLTLMNKKKQGDGVPLLNKTKHDACRRGLVKELDDSSSLILLELNEFLCDNLLKYDSFRGIRHYSSSLDDCELKKVIISDGRYMTIMILVIKYSLLDLV
ncbi:hypothetical protein KY285_035798 [Solanum tuberosum]|nr:hypothetical protein KY289_035998 [Solanum tuberosum]KAH0639212.1 hypothetical protein KY285_035798 [Solanum tuberosum]